MLEDNDVVFLTEALLVLDIDVKIGIAAVEIVHFHAVKTGNRLFHGPIHGRA